MTGNNQTEYNSDIQNGLLEENHNDYHENCDGKLLIIHFFLSFE